MPQKNVASFVARTNSINPLKTDINQSILARIRLPLDLIKNDGKNISREKGINCSETHLAILQSL